jgi:hypothetical protein
MGYGRLATRGDANMSVIETPAGQWTMDDLSHQICCDRDDGKSIEEVAAAYGLTVDVALAIEERWRLGEKTDDDGEPIETFSAVN